MEKKLKFRALVRSSFASYLYFLFLLFFFSSIFSLYLHSTNVTLPIKSEIRTEEPRTAVNQTLFFLAAVIISTLIILWIVIKKKFFLIKLIYITAFSLASFLFLSLFLEPLRAQIAIFNENLAFQITLLLNFFIAVLMIYGIFYSVNQTLRNHSTLLIACIMGSILGEVLALLQLVIFLIFFAVYDIVAVLGPLKRIVKEMDEVSYGVAEVAQRNLERGMFLSLNQVAIGIGDLLLYSATIANLSLLGFNGLVYSIIGITVGSLITIVFARKFKIFPGLPIPVFLTLLLLFIFELS